MTTDTDEQYLRNFDKMPTEKQQKHLLFIINWLVAIIRAQQTDAAQQIQRRD